MCHSLWTTDHSVASVEELCYDGDLGNRRNIFYIFGHEHVYHMIDYTLDSNTHSYRRVEAIDQEHALRLIQYGVDYAKNTDPPLLLQPST